MQSVNVQTTQHVAIAHAKATLLDRILAYLVDFIIIIAYLILIYLTVLDQSFSQWVMISFFLPVIFYHLAFEVFMNGQSPGKKALRIQVVRLDGAAPTLGNYIMRWLLRLVDISLISNTGAIAIVCIAFSKNGQRLGDMAAGTTVIKLNKESVLLSAREIKSMTEDYQPVFTQAANLSDEHIALITEVLEYTEKNENLKPLRAMAAKTRELMNLKESEVDLKSIAFLRQVVKDFRYYTSGS